MLRASVIRENKSEEKTRWLNQPQVAQVNDDDDGWDYNEKLKEPSMIPRQTWKLD